MSQHHTQGRQGQGPRRRYHKGGHSYGNDRRESGGYRPKYKKEAPAKLSLWQRFLGIFGIRPAKGKPAVKDKNPAKTNTRVARSKQERIATPKQPVSNRRLYVGNLSYEATESDLEDVFKGIGEVTSVEIIYNPRTHKSKGYAFVEMKKLEDAVRSVDILHNQPFMGRNLLVSGANERQEQSRQEQSRQEQSRQEQSRQEQSRQEQSRQEQSRQEQSRQEQSRPAREPRAPQEEQNSVEEMKETSTPLIQPETQPQA